MARRQKLVCNACRQRKSRCDGGTPSCSTCAITGRQCHYDKAPSLAHVRALQERIQHLESRQTVPKEGPVPLTFAGQDEESISVDARGDLSYHNLTSAIHETPLEKESASIGAPPSTSSASTATVATTAEADQLNLVESRRALVAHTTAQREQESQHLDLIATQTDIPSPLARTLLQLYWCWLHPSFLFVYRPTFTRDMPLVAQEGGNRPGRSYCSDTLLKVVYAHSCRFLRDPAGIWGPLGRSETFQQFADRLMSEAQVALAMETINPPSIPTIQALLQQSARDMAYGRSSQAWLYSGMAFRMAIDLGIHVSTERLQRYARWLSPEDIELRKRLFWSLYAWDKHISLYLGRMPNFLAGTESIPLDFLDDYTETEPWQPFYGSEQLDNSDNPYPPTPGHVVSCFTALCKLCKILSRLMLELYSPGSHAKTEAVHDSKMVAFVTINEELQAWRSGLPPFLKIDPQNIPALSPPHHITSLNLMYNTTLILLHRPRVAGRRDLNAPAVQRSWKICKTAMRAIHDLLQMYVETFGFSHITYMNSYCTYTAATTAVYQLEIDDEQQKTIGPMRNSIWTELKFLLDVLQRTAVSMTGLNRSIDIIRSRLKKILDRQAASQLQSLFPPHLSSQRMHSSQVNPLFDSPGPLLFFDSGPTSTTSSSSQLNLPNQPPEREYSLEETNMWASWLPAFPGQDVSLGTESLFDCEAGLSPDTRCALMGSNLDPHLSLDYPLTGEALEEYSRFTEGL